jgi:hypothetical protein
MSKRVVLGKFGTSSGEFGLRVSKPTTDAVNTNGTAVSVDNLLFDSLNPTGSFGLYKTILITVPAATGGFSDQQRSPGTITAPFGETLGFTPLAICQKVVSGSLQTSEAFTITEMLIHSNLPPAAGGTLDSGGPNDAGFIWSTSTTGITIKNYETSIVVIRAAIFYTNPTGSLPGGSPSVDEPGDISGTPSSSLVSHQGFKISWNTSADATTYRYDLSTASNFSSYVIEDGGTSATNIIVGGENTSTVSASTAYYFRVRGINAAGDGNYSSTATITTTAALAPVVVLSDSSSTTNDDTANHDAFNYTVTNGGIGCKVTYSSGFSGATSPSIIVPSQPSINVVSASFNAGAWQSNPFQSATRYYYVTADYDDTSAHTATHTHAHTAQGGGL